METETIEREALRALGPIAVIEPVENNHGWLSVINKLVDKGAGPELLTRLFEMQREWEKESQRREFVAAFSAFKAKAPPAIERTGRVGYDGKGGQHVGYAHVELDHAVKKLVPILSEFGLAHSWETEQAESGQISVTCRLEHTAGYSRSITLRGMPDGSGSKNAIQAVGSAIYYLERYTLLAVLGIAQADEDTDAASPVEYITKEEVVQIDELILETHADLARFKKWLQVESLDKIERKHFDKALKELHRKKAQMEKEAGHA